MFCIFEAERGCGYGETVEECLMNLSDDIGMIIGINEVDNIKFYEAKEIKVQCKFEIVKED